MEFTLQFNLQYCIGFCHTSIWICHRYTRVPRPEPCPPSSLYPSYLSLLFSGTLQSVGMSFKGYVIQWACLSLSPLPFASLLFSGFSKFSSDKHFAFLHFLFLGIFLLAASYTVLRTSIHSSSGTRLIRSNALNQIQGIFSLPLYNHKLFNLSHNLMA